MTHYRGKEGKRTTTIFLLVCNGEEVASGERMRCFLIALVDFARYTPVVMVVNIASVFSHCHSFDEISKSIMIYQSIRDA